MHYLLLNSNYLVIKQFSIVILFTCIYYNIMKDLVNEILKHATITITYETTRSKGSNDFYNLQDLKKWLDNNPLIAEQLGYVKKK